MTRPGPASLEDFAGDWVLTRTIDDLRGESSGALQGTASLTPEPGGLLYSEEGALNVAGQPPLIATRRYHWSIAPNGYVAVRFEDGREFHEFPLTRTMPEATHICPPDLYIVTYDFGSWPVWHSEWRVLGPRKDYRMRSSYTRAA